MKINHKTIVESIETEIFNINKKCNIKCLGIVENNGMFVYSNLAEKRSSFTVDDEDLGEVKISIKSEGVDQICNLNQFLDAIYIVGRGNEN